MAVTRSELPTAHVLKGGAFELSRSQLVNPALDGTVEVIETGAGAARWVMSDWRFGPLDDDELSAWSTFFDRQEGRKGSFLGYDPGRPRPLAYKSTADNVPVYAGATDVYAGDVSADISETVKPWGSPRIVGGNISQSYLLVDTLTVGAPFAPRDYVAGYDGTNWHLHRVTVATSADASGLAALYCVPRPSAALLAAAPVAARLEKACAEMQLDAAMPEITLDVAQTATGRLGGVQIFRSVAP